MNIIVGLGNPGPRYARTRHNAGWMLLDTLAQKMKFPHTAWKTIASVRSDVLLTADCVLAKPQTFMNDSGDAVLALLKKHSYQTLAKKTFHNLFIIYDDLDIPVGKYKIVFGSGPKVHNGVTDIVQKLSSDQFWHIRIGSDGRAGSREVDPQDYVLQGFSTNEQQLIDTVLDAASDTVLQAISYDS